MPSGKARCANFCNDEKGTLKAASGRYLKLASNERLNKTPTARTNPERLRRSHFPITKLAAVDPDSTKANHGCHERYNAKLATSSTNCRAWRGRRLARTSTHATKAQQHRQARSRIGVMVSNQDRAATRVRRL